MSYVMRGRRLGLVLLVGAMLLLAMCLQLGSGASASVPAGAQPEAASGAATTQPAPLLPVSAQGAKAQAPPTGWKSFAQQTRQFGDSGSASPLWQMLGMVLVIGVFGIGGLWFVKRLVPKIQQRRGRNIAVLETACLGPSRSVHLLRVGDREFLVASTRERISMLADVTGAVHIPADELGSRGGEL